MIHIKNKDLKKGARYVYLPDIYNEKLLTVAQFLFEEVSNTSNGTLPQKKYVFAVTSDIYEKSKSFKCIQDLHSSNPSDPQLSDYIIEDSLLFFHRYSDRKYKKMQNMYIFFKEKEPSYVKALKFSKLYPSGKESFFWSTTFENFRKNVSFYKFRFCFKICLLYLFGVLKLPLYPVIFLFDIFVSCIISYREYKKAEDEVKNFDKSTNRLLYYMNEKDYTAKKEEAKNSLKEKKETYINKSITIFTLVIAFVTCFLSIYQNNHVRYEMQKENIEYERSITELKNENERLKESMKDYENHHILFFIN